MGFFAVWANDIMLLSSNNAKNIFDFIVGVFYLVVLLCKGSAFMLVGQEMRWFLLIVLVNIFKGSLLMCKENNFFSETTSVF
ncbi:MAG: hypothetical protein ACI3ZV_02885 [Paludibacteraceae bacterium]